MQALPKPKRVLLVCDGNTCRSPMAAAIARQILGASAHVESVGLEAGDGLPPTKHAVTVMEEMGIDISKNRSRDIESINLTVFDLVIAMTPVIAQRLVEIGVDGTKVVGLDVPDPYCKSVDKYRSTAQDIAVQLRTLFSIERDES
jgi:protein arginine phosphatase